MGALALDLSNHYYDPVTGRWTAKDPIRFKGKDANLYGYVINDPINKFDLNGKVSQTTIRCAGNAWAAFQIMRLAGLYACALTGPGVIVCSTVSGATAAVGAAVVGLGCYMDPPEDEPGDSDKPECGEFQCCEG